MALLVFPDEDYDPLQGTISGNHFPTFPQARRSAEGFTAAPPRRHQTGTNDSWQVWTSTIHHGPTKNTPQERNDQEIGCYQTVRPPKLTPLLDQWLPNPRHAGTWLRHDGAMIQSDGIEEP